MKRLFVEALLFVVAVLPASTVTRCIILASSAVAWSLYKCVEAYKAHIIAQERARNAKSNIICINSRVK